jgi:hypothetical protein
MVVGITSIFPHLCALGGPLLRAVLDYLETALATLLFAILSRSGRGSITYEKVFSELLCLIDEKGSGRRTIRQLVEFAFAHVRARHFGAKTKTKLASKESEKLLCLADGTTIFRNTFDIPSALDKINHGAESRHSISTRSTAHSFVVYCGETGYESKTLRVGASITIILELLKEPRRKQWILEKLPVAVANATCAAIDELFRRGVLCDCSDGSATKSVSARRFAT